jgi:formate-dependent nitrite reductase cytochrome c552 subunit
MIDKGKIIELRSDHPCIPTNLEIVRDWIDTGKAEIQESGCIFWVKAKTTCGYGHLRYEGKVQQAHRIVLSHKLGRPIKDGLKACHTCHNPACVSENHLYDRTYELTLEEKTELNDIVRLKIQSSRPRK